MFEFGGKVVNFVFEDVVIDQVVEGIVNGIFFNQGYVCCVGLRFFVQELVVDELLYKLKDWMCMLCVGLLFDKNIDIGVINLKV